MKLTDIQTRLAAPFPQHQIEFGTNIGQPGVVIPTLTPDVIRARLDAACPDWSFHLMAQPDGQYIGTLSLLTAHRSAVGYTPDEAFMAAARLFSIGVYLDRVPTLYVTEGCGPVMPQWALPDHERTPGAAHLLQCIEQLRLEVPEDVTAQRVVYGHLKAALASLHPAPVVTE